LGAYLESDGQVVLEAEHFSERVGSSDHDWLLQTSLPSYTGTSYLQALPDIDIPLVVPSEAITTAPATGYPIIQFTTPGTYTLWSRANAPNAAGDSLYVALDSQPVLTATGFVPGAWSWAKRATSGGFVTIAVTEPGLHILHLWQREDGLRLDRILLTTDSGYNPDSDGPPESDIR
jgi:hypothetical protein